MDWPRSFESLEDVPYWCRSLISFLQRYLRDPRFGRKSFDDETPLFAVPGWLVNSYWRTCVVHIPYLSGTGWVLNNVREDRSLNNASWCSVGVAHRLEDHLALEATPHWVLPSMTWPFIPSYPWDRTLRRSFRPVDGVLPRRLGPYLRLGRRDTTYLGPRGS